MISKIIGRSLTVFKDWEIGTYHIAARAAGGLIIVLMFLTTADVTGRYIFNSPIQGAFDASEVIMVGIVFLGIAYVQLVRGHVKVDIVVSRLHGNGQLLLEIFGFSLGLLVMALIAWQTSLYSWKAFITHDHTMGIVRIPLWPGKSIVALGSGLLCLRLISDIAHNLKRLFHGVSQD
ncbi:TRAP transporter small permease subunit [Chloroflexota bacterium]